MREQFSAYTKLQTSGSSLRLLEINEVKTGKRMREELKRENMPALAAGTVQPVHTNQRTSEDSLGSQAIPTLIAKNSFNENTCENNAVSTQTKKTVGSSWGRQATRSWNGDSIRAARSTLGGTSSEARATRRQLALPIQVCHNTAAM